MRERKTARRSDPAAGMVRVTHYPGMWRLLVRDFRSKVGPWCWLGDHPEEAVIRYRAAQIRAAIRYAIKRSRATSRGRGSK